MLNPFKWCEKSLVNICSGKVASDEVEFDLINAEAIGEERLNLFVKENILTSDADLFTTMKRNNLKTFSSKAKKLNKKDGTLKTSKSSRDLFARVLLAASNREIDLPHLLSHSLADFPLSIATVDGNLKRTAKSKLVHILELNDSVDPDQVRVDAIMVDAMAMIQMLKSPADCFGQLAVQIFRKLMSLATRYSAARVDFVVDRYPDVSIKNAERSRRAGGDCQVINVHSDNQKTPQQWKKNLSVGRNKESLLSCLANSWKRFHSSLFKGMTLYITNKKSCWKLSPVENCVCSSDIVADLECNHEEADTRLLLHAKHASELYDSVLIRTPDTDVIVMCLAMVDEFECNLFVETGTGEHNRILNIKDMASGIGYDVAKSLIGFHAVTGRHCSYYSSFFKQKFVQKIQSLRNVCAFFSLQKKSICKRFWRKNVSR